MKENRQGFTLIELLAVLVVLAILALISVPIVLNIINQSRQKARLRSMEGYAKAVESAVYIYQMDHSDASDVKIINKSEGSYIVANVSTITADTTLTNDNSQKIEYSGSTIVCGANASNTSIAGVGGLTITASNGIELTDCTVDGNNNDGAYYHYWDAQGQDHTRS